MNVHDELVMIRHTMAAVRAELEYINMCGRDYGVENLPSCVKNAHARLYSIGMTFKQRERDLLAELEASSK